MCYKAERGEAHISSMNRHERGKTLEVKLSLALLPWGELSSLLEKLLSRFSWNSVTFSRIWAGDELHSFVLSWFIAFNATRQQSPQSFSQRFFSMWASVLGRNQLIPSSVLPLSPRSPGQGVPSAAPAK